MTQYFTHYWNNPTWYAQSQGENEWELLDHTAGNLFRKRGISIDDIVYVITVIKGELYVLAKLQVGKICGLEEAAKELHWNKEDLWQADDHIIASAATPMHFECKVPIEVTQQLLFVKNVQEPKPPLFISLGILDSQTLRGVRELTPESAHKLDQLLPELQPISDYFQIQPNEKYVPRVIKLTLPQRSYLSHLAPKFEEAFLKALTKTRVYLKQYNNFFPSLAVIEPPRKSLSNRKILLSDSLILEIADYGVVDASCKIRTEPHTHYDITNELGELKDKQLESEFLQGCMNIINLSRYITSSNEEKEWMESRYQDRINNIEFIPSPEQPQMYADYIAEKREQA